MTNLTDFERALIEKFVDGEHPILTELQRQIEILSVRKREKTGVGFYLYLDVPEKLLNMPDIDLRLDDVIADIDELKHGAGFVLYVKDGKLDMLEGYSYDEPWPDSVSKYSVKYDKGDQRDWIELKQTLLTLTKRGALPY
jgi:hypothetical protein